MLVVTEVIESMKQTQPPPSPTDAMCHDVRNVAMADAETGGRGGRRHLPPHVQY